MAIPGDPFATVDLDERRRRQRRHLRTLGPAMLGSATDDVEPTIPPGTDAAWLEEELRRYADLEMIHVGELFRHFEEGRARTMVASFVKANTVEEPEGAFEVFVDSLTVNGPRNGLDGISARELLAARRYLQLARWADAIAAGTEGG